ncbi:MAG TPA: HAMP domain-containing sensor histidine kinase, partial [Chryseosolibacter sp.]
VYSVSHNLRAPLMSVLGLVNLAQLENKNADPSMSNYFHMMQQSIHKLDETLKEILDYSRNARSALHISPVDVRKAIEESFERMKYMDGSDRIRKSIHIRNNAPFFSDSYRLSVILNNLVSNAIKYRDPAKGECVLDVTADITPARLELVVSDNGIGIPRIHVPRIFEMFFRATEKGDGAGLGLYIVRETVEKLEGTVTVQSKNGEGTSFSITLPNMKMVEAEQTDEAAAG